MLYRETGGGGGKRESEKVESGNHTRRDSSRHVSDMVHKGFHLPKEKDEVKGGRRYRPSTLSLFSLSRILRPS